MSLPTDLQSDKIQSLLETQHFGRSLIVKERTGSTNDDAKAAAQAQCAHGHVVIADTQTSGRGSRGRTWESPGGTDLYFSVVFRTQLSPQDAAPITLAVGLGVARAVQSLTQTHAEVKWPNDVLLDQRKCAGILVESSSCGSQIETLIIGVGLDVNRDIWSTELVSQATSLRSRCGRSFARDAVLARVLKDIESQTTRFVSGQREALFQDVHERLAFINQTVSIGTTRGRFLGLDLDGAARLEDHTGRVHRVISGTLRPS